VFAPALCFAREIRPFGLILGEFGEANEIYAKETKKI